MSAAMSDYDQRQYKRMSDILTEFGGSAFGLRKVIGELEALVRCLQDADQSWKQTVWNKIGDLEEVNAFMLDQDREEMNETDRSIVDKAIKELVELVNQVKAEDPKT